MAGFAWAGGAGAAACFSRLAACVAPQEEEFHSLILSLDPRGKKEGELKQALQETFDMADLEKNVKLR